MRRIDLKAILERTVSGLYGDLVTRPTGKAVRDGVERLLADVPGEEMAVIDFGTVRCLDISCADEIVGKLLVEHRGAVWFVLQGVTDSHCDAIEQVLERHQLAVVARDREGRVQVLGPIAEEARRAFSILSVRGPAAAEEVAHQLDVPTDAARRALDELVEWRIAHFASDRYVALLAP